MYSNGRSSDLFLSRATPSQFSVEQAPTQSVVFVTQSLAGGNYSSEYCLGLGVNHTSTNNEYLVKVAGLPTEFPLRSIAGRLDTVTVAKVEKKFYTNKLYRFFSAI